MLLLFSFQKTIERIVLSKLDMSNSVLYLFHVALNSGLKNELRFLLIRQNVFMLYSVERR